MAVTGALSVTVEACRVCGSRAIAPVFDLGRQPLANSLRRERAEVLPTFPLALCRCDACGTVQLTETVSPEVLFRQYVWVTGTSEGARIYSHQFADALSARTRPGARFVIEVASNDGTFLRRFAERGDRVLGVDPARNIAAMAEATGIPTRAEFFGRAVAAQLVAEQGQADAVFARNVIPHVADVQDVVGGMADCLRPDGTGAIEFHRADIILDELHYDSIYHEHLCYHSLHSVEWLLRRFDLVPFDVTTSPISGGSLVVYFSRTARPSTTARDAFLAHERRLGIDREAPWRAFAARCEAHRVALRRMVDDRVAAGRTLIGYGASARSSTLLNYCGIGAAQLQLMADRAPLKHGQFTPGSDVRIVAPAEALAINPDGILLLGWNFRDEILGQIAAEHGWHGEVIVPLPGDPTVATI